MRHFTSAALLVLHLLFAVSLSATTIVPYPTQAELAAASDLIMLAEVTGTFEDIGDPDGDGVRFTRKGFELSVIFSSDAQATGTTFRIMSDVRTAASENDYSIDDFDCPAEVGRTYVFFLRAVEGEYVPVTGSLGMYETVGVGQEEFAVPVPSQDAFYLPHPSGRAIEARRIYSVDVLLDASVQAKAGQEIRIEELAAELPEHKANELRARAIPTFCNPFEVDFQNSNFPILNGRWATPAITLYAGSDSNPAVGSTNARALLQDAIAELNSNYPGLALTYGGVEDVRGTECLVSARAEPTPVENSIVVVFNEACSNTALSRCSGTLGVGGPSFNSERFTAPTPDGDTRQYYRITSGGVAISGDAVCLSPRNYVLMLTHEITHALGFGHISEQDGDANINPQCCDDISNLDQACVNEIYVSQAALPVELTTFAATASGDYTDLAWTTASETNNAGFEVQRSDDGTTFQAIAAVEGAGTTTALTNYTHTDYLPLSGTSYYRLLQTDFDGATSLSEVVAVSRSDAAEALRLVPNPASAGQMLQVSGLADAAVELRLIDAAGRTVLSTTSRPAGGQVGIELPVLPQGLYYLEARGPQAVRTEVLNIR